MKNLDPLILKFDNSFNGRLFAVQADTGRVINLQIFNDLDTPVDITGMSIRFYVGNSEQVSYSDGTITDAAQGKVEVPITNSMLAYSGINKAQFVLTEKDGKKVGSKVFDMHIDESVENGATVGRNIIVDFSKIDEAVKLLKDYDKTLQDAKETDAALKTDIDTGTELSNNLNKNIEIARNFDFDGDIQKAKVASDDLVTKTTAADKARTSLDESVTTATSTNETLNNTNEDAKSTSTNLNNSISTAKNTKTELDASINSGGTLKTDLQTENQKATENIASLSEKTDAGTTVVGNIEKSITEGKQTKTALDGSIATAKDTKTGLDTSISTGQGLNDSLSSKVQSATAVDGQIKTKMDTVQGWIDNPKQFKGDKGDQGIQGPPGPIGKGLTVLGKVTSSSQLPSTGTTGDAYFVGSHLYVWTGSKWEDMGEVKGEKGDQGIQGPRGEQGPTGPKGDTGAKGDKGDAGPVGPQGPIGLTGPKGADGERGVDGRQGIDGKPGKDGVSVIHSWSGTTLSITSASGTSSADLKGPKGDRGATGPKGDPATNLVKSVQGKTGEVMLTKADITALGFPEHVVLTQAQYDALSSTQKADTKVFYYIKKA